jgi:hypothetical protein
MNVTEWLLHTAEGSWIEFRPTQISTRKLNNLKLKNTVRVGVLNNFLGCLLPYKNVIWCRYSNENFYNSIFNGMSDYYIVSWEKEKERTVLNQKTAAKSNHDVAL